MTHFLSQNRFKQFVSWVKSKTGLVAYLSDYFADKDAIQKGEEGSETMVRCADGKVILDVNGGSGYAELDEQGVNDLSDIVRKKGAGAKVVESHVHSSLQAKTGTQTDQAWVTVEESSVIISSIVHGKRGVVSLDAPKLNKLNTLVTNDYAKLDHNHDTQYAPVSHSHSEYAEAEHSHIKIMSPNGNVYVEATNDGIVLFKQGLSVVLTQAKLFKLNELLK